MIRSAAVEQLEERTLFSVPAGYTQSLLAGGLSSPTAMAVAPDGRIFVSEQAGNLRVIKNGSTLSTPFVHVNTTANGERGLLGVAFDPNFNSNHFLYVYYTASSPTPHNRISRFTAAGDIAVAGSEHVVMDLPALGAATEHNGGAMHFGPDGDLYVAVGDNAIPDNSQSLTSVFGKMLRIRPDGSIPSDNPFYSQTSGVYRAIWATGLRNPFTFAFQPGSGKMYINDVGDDGDTATEEIDVGKAGANYGWPLIQGFRTNQPPPANYKDPLYGYQHGPNAINGTSIVGGVFYSAPAGAAHPFPTTFNNDYLFGDFGGGWIHDLDTTSITEFDFVTGVHFGVDLAIAPDGSLLYVSRGAPGVYRVAYTGTAAPSIAADPQNLTVNPDQPATFTVQASGQGALAYQWMRDGKDISGATAATYTLADPQPGDSGAVFAVRVSNAAGSVTSRGATLTVTTDQAPLPTINLPSAGSKFVAGAAVNFSGSAADAEDGAEPASQLTWSVSYFTDGVERPFVAAFSGQNGGSFTPPTITPYKGTDVFFRIYLTATDSSGRQATVTRDVQPTISNFTLSSNITGLQLSLDGTPHATPLTIASVVGLDRELSAPATQVLNGVTYTFAGWSDGGAMTHDISAPAASTTYTATYRGQQRTLAPIADASVAQSSPATNFGSATTLAARASSSVYARISYLTFDLSGVNTINSALLQLWGKQDVAGHAVTVSAYTVSGAWSEKTITWNNRPALGSAVASVSVNSTTGRWYQWDLTSYLKSQKAAGKTRVTIALAGLSATTPIALFNSREAAANRPLLEIS